MPSSKYMLSYTFYVYIEINTVIIMPKLLIAEDEEN